MSSIVIVGGGASGIVASIFAKKEGNMVIVLERNDSLLKKLLMTGNGRCNYLNEVYSINNYYSEDIDLVSKIINDTNISDVFDFFNSLGIIPTVKNGYYYPFSNQATTIKNALVKEALNRGVEVVYNAVVTDIDYNNFKFNIKTSSNSYVCDKLILACGGMSMPKTGSDGSGYKFLEKLGHSIVKPLPSLVQLTSDFKYLKYWDGVRTSVILKLFQDDNYITSESGEIQLTDYGVSGICVFNLTNIISRGLDLGSKEEIRINFVPFVNIEIDLWLEQYSRKHFDKNIRDLLELFLNYKLVKVILKVSNLDEMQKYEELTDKEKKVLCDNLVNFKVNITGTKGFSYAQITNGGVKLSEIDYNTMESKIIKGLYIIGELLDINGNCGGYNLTSCWISGMLAGKDV